MSNKESQENIARWLRRKVLEMTTRAGSGHPTSCLSAVELTSVLLFDERGFFRYDIQDPENAYNDRLIFSKGHASPLLYALFSLAGGLPETELSTLRTFGSRLEGHPTRAFPFTEVPTGSLGQGLAVGVGEALALRQQLTINNVQLTEEEMSNVFPRIWVFLGDSELAEGSIWESAEIASYYHIDTLVAIVDASRLGQSNVTMDAGDVEKIAKKFEAFGWRAIRVDGHNAEAIATAYQSARESQNTPTVIVAKTIKGKGVSFLENIEGWHGKALSKEECERAILEIGAVDKNMEGILQKPTTNDQQPTTTQKILNSKYKILNIGERVSPRAMYGKALSEVAEHDERIVALDAEVKNSTYAVDFEKVFPERFYEMFIAEQTMVGVATGMARRGMLPFVSTFSAFFSRAFDQIRMAQYAKVPIVCVGSHCGVSIGEDGASQMGLEDMAMFRAILGSVVLYPSDAVSMRACVQLATKQKGVTYIRSTRADLPVLYSQDEAFVVAGSKTLRESNEDVATIVTAGITVHEALKAYETLRAEGVLVRVIDAYSIKPIDSRVLQKAARETSRIIVVEDHFAEGGLADAVRSAVHSEQGIGSSGTGNQDVSNVDSQMSNVKCQMSIISLAVRKMPKSGKPEELLRYEEIDAEAIVEAVRSKEWEGGRSRK